VFRPIYLLERRGGEKVKNHSFRLYERL